MGIRPSSIFDLQQVDEVLQLWREVRDSPIDGQPTGHTDTVTTCNDGRAVV